MKTVLVVDDSQTIRTAIRWTLAGPDFEVLVSPDPVNGRRVLMDRRPDLVLLDVGLGQVSGFDVCAELKASPETAAIPVLLMGSALEPFDAARAEGVQADGHLQKPFDTQTLIDTVRSHLGLPLDETTPTTYAGRLARRRQAEAEGRAAPPSSPPPIPVDAPPPPAPFAPPPSEASRDVAPPPAGHDAPARGLAEAPASGFEVTEAPAPASSFEVTEAPAPAPVSSFEVTEAPGPAPSSSFEVTIEESDPVEIDADELEEVDGPRRADPTLESDDGISPPAGPSLEPPPAPTAAYPAAADVDVWALADDGGPPRPPPPRMPPPLAPPAPAEAAPSPVEPPGEAAEPRVGALGGDPTRSSAAIDGAAAHIAEAAAAQAPLQALPKEELRAIAREVIEAIAWEVVPDLAETIIREELARLTETSST